MVLSDPKPVPGSAANQGRFQIVNQTGIARLIARLIEQQEKERRRKREGLVRGSVVGLEVTRRKSRDRRIQEKGKDMTYLDIRSFKECIH